MKKLLTLLMVLCLVVGLCFALTACGEEPDTGCVHEWNKGTTTKQPTCTEAGVKTFVCTLCGETKTEAVDATGHTWENEITVEADVHYYACENCEAKKDEAAHDFVKNTAESTASNCGVQGHDISYCSVCNKKKDVKLDLVGEHTLPETYGTDDDQHFKTCSVCQQKVGKEDHDWEITSETGITYTSCQPGTIAYKCSVCAKEKTLPLASGAVHDLRYAYNTEDQTIAVTCAVCGATVGSTKQECVKDFEDLSEGTQVSSVVSQRTVVEIDEVTGNHYVYWVDDCESNNVFINPTPSDTTMKDILIFMIRICFSFDHDDGTGTVTENTFGRFSIAAKEDGAWGGDTDCRIELKASKNDPTVNTLWFTGTAHVNPQSFDTGFTPVKDQWYDVMFVYDKVAKAEYAYINQGTTQIAGGLVGQFDKTSAILTAKTISYFTSKLDDDVSSILADDISIFFGNYGTTGIVTHEHTWGDPTNVKPATCGAGSYDQACTVCGYSETVEVPAEEGAEHVAEMTEGENPVVKLYVDYVDGDETKGLEAQHYSKCKNCGEKINYVDHNFETKVDAECVAGDCVTLGKDVFQCACGAKNEVPVGGGHTWVVDTVIVTASCGKEGATKYKCSKCEAADSHKVEKDAALAHNYVATVAEQTLTLTCSDCTKTFGAISYNTKWDMSTAVAGDKCNDSNSTGAVYKTVGEEVVGYFIHDVGGNVGKNFPQNVAMADYNIISMKIMPAFTVEEEVVYGGTIGVDLKAGATASSVSWAGFGSRVGVDAQGNLINNGKATGNKAVADQWYDVTFIYDQKNDTLSTIFDGVTVHNVKGNSVAKTAAVIGYWTINCNSSSQMYFKDVTYYTGAMDASIVLPCAEHAMGAEVEVVKTSCGVQGVYTKTCSACGAVTVEVKDALTHNYEAYAAETVAPDCTTAGVNATKCSNCQDVKTEAVAALGHNYTFAFDGVANTMTVNCARCTTEFGEKVMTNAWTLDYEAANAGDFASQCKGAGSNSPLSVVKTEGEGETANNYGFWVDDCADNNVNYNTTKVTISDFVYIQFRLQLNFEHEYGKVELTTVNAKVDNGWGEVWKGVKTVDGKINADGWQSDVVAEKDTWYTITYLWEKATNNTYVVISNAEGTMLGTGLGAISAKMLTGSEVTYFTLNVNGTNAAEVDMSIQPCIKIDDVRIGNYTIPAAD